MLRTTGSDSAEDFISVAQKAGSKPEKPLEVLNPRNVERWHTDDGTNPHPMVAIVGP